MTRFALTAWFILLAGLGACDSSPGDSTLVGGTGGCNTSDPCSGCAGLSASNCSEYDCVLCSDLIGWGWGSGSNDLCDGERDLYDRLNDCMCVNASPSSNPPGCAEICDLLPESGCSHGMSSECQTCVATTCALELSECGWF